MAMPDSADFRMGMWGQVFDKNGCIIMEAWWLHDKACKLAEEKRAANASALEACALNNSHLDINLSPK